MRKAHRHPRNASPAPSREPRNATKPITPSALKSVARDLETRAKELEDVVNPDWAWGSQRAYHQEARNMRESAEALRAIADARLERHARARQLALRGPLSFVAAPSTGTPAQTENATPRAPGWLFTRYGGADVG